MSVRPPRATVAAAFLPTKSRSDFAGILPRIQNACSPLCRARRVVTLVSAIGARRSGTVGPVIEMQVTRGALAGCARAGARRRRPAVAQSRSARTSAGPLPDGRLRCLRGSTNPPPRTGFTRCDTWTGKCAKEGMTIRGLPRRRRCCLPGAGETGGDLQALMNAVRRRAGAFRAHLAGPESGDPGSLAPGQLPQGRPFSLGEDDRGAKEAAPLLARSLMQSGRSAWTRSSVCCRRRA